MDRIAAIVYCILLIAQGSTARTWSKAMSSPSAVLIPSSQSQTRIVNGAPAHEFQFPWFVSIRSQTPQRLHSLCGGSVISADWVLTAAHCTHGYTSHQLAFGSTHIQRPRLEMRVHEVRQHPRYNADNLNNDVALLRLPQRLQFTAHVQAIRMPARSQSAAGHFYSRVARVCGYGRVADDRPQMSDQLQWVDKRIISNGQCTQTYGPQVVLRSTVCTIGWEYSEQGTCNGDSGGPLVVDEGGVWTQIGIVSFVSQQGCGAGYPAGYVRTGAYLDWIAAQTAIAVRER